MRSTTRPTSRKTARIITRATWRWCAARSRKFRWCSPRRRPRSNPKSMRGAAAIARVHLPERFGGQHLPHDRGDRPARAKARRAAASSRRGSPKRCRSRSRRGEQALLFLNRRGYAPLTLVPRLRLPPAMPELRRLAGRSPLQAPAGLPSLRLRDAAAGRMPEMPRHRQLRRRSGPGVERLEQEAAELFPGSAHPGAVERSGRIDRAAAQRARRRRRKAASTSSSARSSSPRAIISPSSIWSASSMPISASATAIRAPPSARSNCCIRWSGRAGREEGRGLGYLQTHQPEHPVMRALISGDREAFYRSEIELRERTHYPPFGRLASLVDHRPTTARGGSLRPRACRRRAAEGRAVRVLGPAEAPIAVVRGRHRFRLLVKSPRAFDLSGYLRDWLAARRSQEAMCELRSRCRSAELLLKLSDSHSGISACFTFGCSSTQAAAAKIRRSR